jgi:ribosomal protein S18 acetylase RimI-like enzyme
MTMIRAITEADAAAVVEVAVAAGLFAPEDAAFLDKMMADYFGSKRDDGHVCVIDVDERVMGVVYYEPALATDGTWYVTMIGVRRDAQGRGHGAALMRHVEDALRAEGQRLVLVETSGTPEFALTRQFYAKLGYEEAARVRDYFIDGDDMVLFWKALRTDR